LRRPWWGGGDGLAQQALNGEGMQLWLPLLFLLRLGLIAVSVAAGTSGGLLVPFLALGAELGLWVDMLCALAFPGLALDVHGFAVVGMATLFTAIVRTPLTAAVLVCEMTASATMWLPLTLSCCAAMLVPTLFGDLSILDSLKDRLPAQGEGVARTIDQLDARR
jgi:CIC family chloride channel protein